MKKSKELYVVKFYRVVPRIETRQRFPFILSFANFFTSKSNKMNSVWTKEPVIKKKIRKNNVWRPTLFLSSFKQNYEFFHGKLKSKKKKEKKVIVAGRYKTRVLGLFALYYMVLTTMKNTP